MIIENKIVECAQAQILLENAGLAEYPPVVYPPVIDNQKNIQITSPENSIVIPASEVLEIYPNPANEALFVEYLIINTEFEENHYIEIYTETGDLIEKIQITNKAGVIPLNIRKFAPAVYIVKLNNTTLKFTKM